MDLQLHYDQLFAQSSQQNRQYNVKTDPLLDTTNEDRRGITLLLRPDSNLHPAIQAFLGELQRLAPSQYYYPTTDFHLTVLSIISCYPGFQLSQITIGDYVRRIQMALTDIAPFEIRLQGVSLSPSAVLLQGFVPSDQLNHIRQQLRLHFTDSGLQQSIDSRYRLATAHSTVVRFRQPLTQVDAFLALLETYRHTLFGTWRVEALYLVYNDWYQRDSRVQTLHRFPLG